MDPMINTLSNKHNAKKERKSWVLLWQVSTVLEGMGKMLNPLGLMKYSYTIWDKEEAGTASLKGGDLESEALEAGSTWITRNSWNMG